MAIESCCSQKIHIYVFSAYYVGATHVKKIHVHVFCSLLTWGLLVRKTLKKRKLQTPTYLYIFKILLVKLIRGVDHICDLFPLQFFDKI